MYKVDNAVILAAGMASRFVPISYEMPKALITVKGEILLERQIRQLQEAGIEEIIIVVGHLKEQFKYLVNKFNVRLIENQEYLNRNNNSSIYAVKKYLRNTFIFSSDNYFEENPFENEVDDSYYAAIYADGVTKEWCMEEGQDGYISRVEIGGSHSWYMLGHAFWSEEFSRKFINILDSIYYREETVNMLWEDILIDHLDELKMKIRKYNSGMIYEFDTLDELRAFDVDYIENSHSIILKELANKLECREREIVNLKPYKVSNEIIGFEFDCKKRHFLYKYETNSLKKIM